MLSVKLNVLKSLSSRFYTIVITLLFSLWAAIAHAEEQLVQPKVGSKVASNMDVASMLLSLVFVLVLIVLAAWLLKKFNLVQQQGGQLKVIASYQISTKEKLLVVEVGEQQLLLGVTANQINLLTELKQPLQPNEASNLVNFPQNVLERLKK